MENLFKFSEATMAFPPVWPARTVRQRTNSEWLCSDLCFTDQPLAASSLEAAQSRGSPRRPREGGDTSPDRHGFDQ
jgi:hypothetical protein